MDYAAFMLSDTFSMQVFTFYIGAVRASTCDVRASMWDFIASMCAVHTLCRLMKTEKKPKSSD